MTLVRNILICQSIVFIASAPGWTQSQPERKGFWANVQLGYGLLDMSSDQEPRRRQDTFAMGFNLGSTLNPHLRLGVEINGWLLESSDPYDPAKGESTSQTFAIVQAYPWSSRGFFFKAGLGRAMYTNHHPFEFGSSGWGMAMGMGYDLAVAKKISLTTMVNFSRGSLGGVKNQLVTIQNRNYSVFEFLLALSYP